MKNYGLCTFFINYKIRRRVKCELLQMSVIDIPIGMTM